MKRWLTVTVSMLAISAAALSAALSWAQEREQPSPVMIVDIPPFDVSRHTYTLAPGAEAVVTLIGNGRTAVGIYTYDALGRCVAFDDETSLIVDDRAVAWRVTSPLPYEVHLRNFGAQFNRGEVSFRVAP